MADLSGKSGIRHDDIQLEVGCWVTTVRTPAMMGLLRDAGLQYGRVDMEHTPISIETVGELAVAASAIEFALSVRLPNGNPEWIARGLHAGASRLCIPQVSSPEYAHAIVDAVRREAARGRPHLTIMLETVESIQGIDELCAVPGVDAVTMGPADLAQELGIWGTSDEKPVTTEYQHRLLEAAHRHGKQFEIGVWSKDDVEEWIGAGADLLTYHTDTDMLRLGLHEAVRRARAASEEMEGS